MQINEFIRSTGMEVIDFHTHPFLSDDTNICSHLSFCPMTAEKTETDLQGIGISKIAGSVIFRTMRKNYTWEYVRELNDDAMKLHEQYGDFYYPGFHVHPAFVRESCEEIERMAKKGFRLIGELVPYHQEWSDYSCPGFSEILDTAEQYDMLVSFHSMGEDEMDKMVKEHPKVRFAAAHPGEYREFMRHMERMKTSENYYLDVSGYGIFRHGLLRHAIDLFGSERFLYGSDYPICNPAMYLGGVLLDCTLSDAEKENVLGKNAKRLLGI